ncbi:MAG: Uma2 family endonuclease [Ferruginibacter sp.]|nr:Uma2 family endonuclease [Cytophagales bacterium]
MKTTELLSDYELERGKPLPNTLAKRSDAPLLCVEIQSFSQSPEEMIEKVARYFAFGVKYCWVVVPSLQAVLVYDQPSHY